MSVRWVFCDCAAVALLRELQLSAGSLLAGWYSSYDMVHGHNGTSHRYVRAVGTAARLIDHTTTVELRALLTMCIGQIGSCVFNRTSPQKSHKLFPHASISPGLLCAVPVALTSPLSWTAA